MRQAVCISLHVERDSLTSANVAFHPWVNEIRARAIDHGGDLISIREGVLTVLFFAGELSVRHNDTHNSGQVAHRDFGSTKNHKKLTAKCDIDEVAGESLAMPHTKHNSTPSTNH